MTFEVKAYPELWQSLDVDVERFDKARLMLGESFEKSYLHQKNRPSAMAYFDEMIAEIHGGRIQELVQAKEQGRPVIGTFCVYIPEEIFEFNLRHHKPSPFSGKDGLLIEQIAFYDEPVRFAEKVNELCDELETVQPSSTWAGRTPRSSPSDRTAGW